ncbi:PEST proteolytic signal-containing nuclear protein [Tribolium castaneum]|uniref:PEST proteolytic signal-containing nuclear protein n=1 Tax=Tribolium castaneum TaxID=7070 RepID=D6WUZ3_TRICA|nr:PREDICTED: PEST proteolytic signal-containing nuclear protein [Tribolium castaneum]EFA08511.1 PEST proteolytic signal-containing nuclear protein-like Protein [Tribolium castaneum]|eukprot:XP_973889.1 PREDICTED: PEST proteolytic signal-containing nuclear protein [Tribolium castaneum]
MSDKKGDKFNDHGKDRDRSRSPHRRPENVALDAKKRLKTMGIQMKLSSQKQTAKPKLTIAAAFNQESDEEPEEMPPEARMRMRNIGRDTPTSSGPNSFGKTKQGFSESKKPFDQSPDRANNTAK